MAGDWIKMRTALAEDPDVIRIAGILQQDRFAVVGRLHSLWSWADQNSVDGSALSVTFSFLDDLVRCDGFCEALINVNWLAGEDWSVSIPGFERHNGDSAKKRGLDTKRKSLKRTAKDNSADGPDEVRHMSGQEADTTRTESGTREEKRREENIPLTKVNGGNATGEPSQQPASSIPGPPFTHIVDKWNLIMGQRVRLTQKRRATIRQRWADAFWRESWLEALNRGSKLRWWRGENDHGWTADLDYFLRPDTVTKVMEGSCEDRNGNGAGKPTADPYAVQQTTLEVF